MCIDDFVLLRVTPERVADVESVTHEGPCSVTGSCDAGVCERYVVAGTGAGACRITLAFRSGESENVDLRFGDRDSCCDGNCPLNRDPGETIRVP